MTEQQLFRAPPQPATTDERFTPAWVFDGLGLEFDLDPASPLHHDTAVPARRKLTVEDDGLTAPWEGLVWLNPPYSNAAPWADRFIDHANGVWLSPYANSKWFFRMLRAADLVGFAADFAFVHPEHSGQRAGMALFFAAFGVPSRRALARLARADVHDIVLMAHT